MEKSFQESKFKSLIIGFLIFLFPLFFLPITQEFFITNKLYLLIFVALILLIIFSFKLLISRKIFWQFHPLDIPLALFVVSIAVSTLITSTNKVQAILNPNFGLAMFVSLIIFYFFFSRTTISSIVYYLSSIVLSIFTIIFYFQPFKNIALPSFFQFLKNPSFTPIGSQLDLAFFLGFFVVLGIVRVILVSDQAERGSASRMTKNTIINYLLLAFNLVALFLTVYQLIHPAASSSTLILPPISNSWYGAVEVLKNPLTAIFGVGVDNFSVMFTRVKDFSYNQSALWQIGSFNYSRSAILHVLTETGVFGLVSFVLLILAAFRVIIRQTGSEKILNICLFVYLLICLLFFPPSLIVFFLFFLGLSQIKIGPVKNSEVDLNPLPLVYVGVFIISLFAISFSVYLAGRNYLSEYYFKKSLDGYVENNAKKTYDNMREARLLNPYTEKYVLNFSQINLILASNLASKKNLTDAERQQITQAIQAAIAEGKELVRLNPNRADSWLNLANIYKNVINLAQGADTWTISSYQRAIILDPSNPQYRFNLGGLYYQLKDYPDAVSFFEQVVNLKPQWANGYYNLAWSYYQNKEYDKAVSAMQATQSLINPKNNKADYDTTQKDLTEFKKMLPATKTATTTETKPGTLALPSPPATKISPKLELPKEASPEAK